MNLLKTINWSNFVPAELSTCPVFQFPEGTIQVFFILLWLCIVSVLQQFSLFRLYESCAYSRSANLILNLFSLMVDATVPDIALEPDKTVKKVQDKFCLDLTDEEAVHYMQGIIDVSVTATMAVLLEKMHTIAQVRCSFISQF